MHKDTQPINHEAPLIEANKVIYEHEDTPVEIIATGAAQRNGVLVFSGDYLLDERGLPTPKSMVMFSMFKHLTHVLSEKYHSVN